MSVYNGKMLELVAIEKSNEKVYLHMNLSIETEVEFFLEIDHDTAKNLIDQLMFDQNHKFRLSLHTTLDPAKNQYMGSITKTYTDKSERIYFACSEDFENHLAFIRNIQNINDLYTLPFLSFKPLEKKTELQNKAGVSMRFKLPMKWVRVAITSIIFFILFGYTNNAYLHSDSISRTTFANAEAKTPEVIIKNKKDETTSPTANLEKEHSIHSSLPFIKLNDFSIYKVPTGYVSLTFDDGPSKYTERIVDILKKYKVGGTFFFIGVNVNKYPDYVRYVHSNGYSIGSHSMNHLEMSKLSYEKQESELQQSSMAIEAITNEKVTLFRPPYEALNEQTKEVVAQYHDKMILWNKDTEDWKTRNAEKIYNYIHSTKASGSIILLHESQPVIDALPKIIEDLQRQSLKIISLQ
ncbi:MAG: polysaccharide deacetylase family protein [Bacillota bacterium]|nr:polysaccharide deacetylase family protein [Bacillota bacterium]